ncbi:MAG: hypothetical protein KF795_02400 [Labilithrix sp.]|nr:hypothetical protein [Labilithrix sp.]
MARTSSPTRARRRVGDRYGGMWRALVGSGAIMIVACGGATGTRDPIRSVDEISNDYRGRLHELYANGAREIVWPKCDEPTRPPDAPCGYVADELLSPAYVDRFRSTVCNEPVDAPVSDACFERFERRFLGRISERYPRASADNTVKQCAELALDCSRLALLDIAALAAHNAAVRARVSAEADALVAEHREELVKRGRQVATIDQARERDAAAWSAVAAGFAAFSRGALEGMSAAPQDTSSEFSPPAARRCSSDLACGVGNVCVKAELQFDGVCARAVDRNGIPTYPAPRGNLGPGGRGQCSFDTDCPVGFSCLKNGALTGNCVK